MNDQSGEALASLKGLLAASYVNSHILRSSLLLSLSQTDTRLRQADELLMFAYRVYLNSLISNMNQSD